MKFRDFIETYFEIDDPNQGGAIVPFKFRPIQVKYYEQLCKDYKEEENFSGLREAILKARKVGFTSVILGLYCADIIYNKNPVRYLEISYKDDATSQHFTRAKRYVMSYFRKKMQTDMDDKRLERMIFSNLNEGSEFTLAHNGASFYIGTASVRTGERGGTVQGILFSEAAHYPNTGILKSSEIIEGTRNMVQVDTGMIFLETTANGMGYFYDLWGKAKKGEVDYRPRFFGWREFYTEEQFVKIKAGFADKTMIAQEYPANDMEAFLASGDKFFDKEALKHYLEKATDPMIAEVIYR